MTAKSQQPIPPIDREIMVSKVFTPATPVSESDLFAGRLEQLRRVVDTINQRGQHAVVFGERGVGKTSLASVIASRLRVPGTTVIAPRVNCDSNDTYETLWRKVLSQIDLLRKTPTVGFQISIFEETVKAADAIGGDVSPDSIRRLLALLGDTGVIIIVFDEFDRIVDPMVRRTMADTIKALSDHDIAATLVIVGVADSIQELISEHESIERALKQTRMPRMSPSEIKQILDNGMKRLQMDISDEAKAEIAVLSQGLPHYAHLLGLHSTRVALDRNSESINISDVDAAIRKALIDVDQTIRSVYDSAVFSPQKDNLYAHVLLACALAKTGEFGFFPAAVVREPLSDITGKPYDIPGFSRHLNDFCEESRGRILHKEGKKRKFRFRFRNPLMQPLIIMKGLSEGRISKHLLRKYHY